MYAEETKKGTFLGGHPEAVGIMMHGMAGTGYVPAWPNFFMDSVTLIQCDQNHIFPSLKRV
jgi:hypothetical protein